VIVPIHISWECLPFIAGIACALLVPVQNHPNSRALIIKVGLAVAMGTASAYVARELAAAILTAITSIIIDSGAAALGLIVAHVLVKRTAVFRSNFREP
jgi:hypothetical protein